MLNKRPVLICLLSVLCALNAAVLGCPIVQAQPGLGGSNLFTNSGLIDSGPTYNSNPYNAMSQLAAPKIPLGKRKPGEAQQDTDMDWQPAYLQPFPIAYLNIPQLRSGTRDILSESYFVAINGPDVKTFAQLYKNNRLENISSFITADSITHPFLAFQNAIRLAVVDQSVAPLLKSLLVSMLEAAHHDYLETEDVEVKEEIKYNLAYLAMAVKLLQPDYVIPDYPGVKQLVESELNSIKKKRIAYSVIFHRPQNFAKLDPIGWHKSTPAAQRFFGCCQWLGTMSLDLTDTEGSNGNEFRRGFLLFQSLMKATIPQEHADNEDNSGYALWQKINVILGQLGLNQADDDSDNFQLVLPSSFAGIFPTAKSVSRITIASLSNPLNRTRLFLTLKSNTPKKHLNATSIFSLNKSKTESEKPLKFGLINPLYRPDIELCFKSPVFQQDAAAGFSHTPIALLLAQNKGSIWAKRVLSDNASKLNSQLTSLNSNQIVSDVFWETFKNLNTAYMDPSPQVLQTKQWRTFCLEREVAAWVDKMLSCGIGGATPPVQDASPEKDGIDSAVTKDATINSVIRKFGLASWRTASSFNYLEPANGLYEKMAESETNFEHALMQANLFPTQYIERSHDFTRFLKRLAAIANVELNNQAINAEDQSLLGGMEKVFQIIEPPVPGNLYIPFGGGSNDADLAANVIAGEKIGIEPEEKPAPKKLDNSNVIKLTDGTNQSPTSRLAYDSPQVNSNKGVKLAGVNMGLGYPTSLYVIVQFKRVYYLLRGAAYSYHEQCGAPINSKNWQSQLDMGFYMDPPFWCQQFQR